MPVFPSVSAPKPTSANVRHASSSKSVAICLLQFHWLESDWPRIMVYHGPFQRPNLTEVEGEDRLASAQHIREPGRSISVPGTKTREEAVSTYIERGNAFEKEVEQLLRLKGYSVSRNELINGTQIDLIARKNDLMENLCFVVECTHRDHPVGVELVKQKAATLLSLNDNRYLFRLLLVARSGFTAEAKAFAHSQPSVLLLNITDLEDQLVDFRPYVDWYIYNYENSTGMFREGDLFENFVELLARDEQDRTVASLTLETRRWLAQDSNNLLFLLGEYGAGKTSFCRHLVYELLMEKYRRNEPQRYIAILINLREYRSAFSIRQVITDSLINQSGVALPSFMAFEHVCSTGKILLVLDGFDEMASTSDTKTLIDCFSQIYVLANLNTKIILTCRSNFFQSHADILELFKRFSINIPTGEEPGSPVIHMTFERHGRILHLERLNPEQVREFVTKRFPSGSAAVLNQISAIHDLTDLSTRPVLLDMILRTLPELQGTTTRLNSAALYQYYTDKWSARDEWRVISPSRLRQDFCETLAWVMHSMGLLEVEYEILEIAMIRAIQLMTEQTHQLSELQNDLQTCSFLIRVPNRDMFRFAHKSFLEYFVARKIARDISNAELISLTTEDHLRNEVQSDQPINSHSGARIDDFYIAPSTFWRTSILDLHGDYPRGTLHYSYLPGKTRLLSEVVRERWWQQDFLSLNPRQGTAKAYSVMKQHLEEELKRIIAEQTQTVISEELRINEEIATFAIECLDNSEESLEQFVSRVENVGMFSGPSQSLALFSDIVRLAKPSEFIRRSHEFIKKYIDSEHNHVRLKAAFAAALVSFPDLIDLDFVRSVRLRLPAEAWTYFLFSMANRQQDYSVIVRTVFEWEGLSIIDRIICIHAMRDSLAVDERNLVTDPLILELLASSDDNEVALGVALSTSLSLTDKELFELMESVLQRVSDREIKKEAISIMGTLQGSDLWRRVRVLAAQQQDPYLRQLLHSAVQGIRRVTDLAGNRIGWDQRKGNTEIRDRIWKATLR